MDKELEESYKHFKNILDNASPFTMSPYTYRHLATLLNYIENSIPKEVVEEKIVNLDKEEQELQNGISDEEREEYSDASIGYELSYIAAKRETLQELLQEKGEK